MSKFSLICLAAACLAVAVNSAPANKIEAPLRKSLELKPLANILVSFGGTEAALAQVEAKASTFATRAEKGQAVYDSLVANAQASHQNVLNILNSPKFFTLKVESLWITNQVLVRGADKSLIEYLATLPEVSSIAEEEIIYLEEVEADPQEEKPRDGILAEWGVEIIQAPAAWAASNRGEGAVVGIIDTGARVTHEALRDNYRGGTHSWFNPLSSNSQTPVDGNGHGTHCTGTIAGTLGIGVAPGAKWISCKGLSDGGSGASGDLIRCGQFMTCPTRYDGSDARCDLAPDAVSNSWGGAGGRDLYDGMVAAWQSAGIIPVSSNGNNGPSCSSSGTPADSRSGILGIGATTNTDAIASFSSRGPSNWGAQKPEISAPGNAVRSAAISSDTAYTTMSGTSMACPHVAGLVALIRAKNQNLTYAQVKSILETTAQRTGLVSTGETCSGVTDRVFPNYKFGHGRINALAAVNGTPRP